MERSGGAFFVADHKHFHQWAYENGHYYDSCRSKTPSKLAKDSDLINKLWAKSLEWTNAPDLKPHASS